jgi:hypothetical protein
VAPLQPTGARSIRSTSLAGACAGRGKVFYRTSSLEYSGEKLAQIKIIAGDDTIEKFKQIVLAKHGKLELSVEGEEALKLYIKRHEKLLGKMVPPEQDPLRSICAIARSDHHHNVLKELELLEAG